jgi:uncharacterized membrane protein YfcA
MKKCFFITFYMKDTRRVLLTILIGMTSGIIGGATGIGGAFVIIPLLYLLNVISDYSTIVGTSLFALLFPISILAVLEYAKYDEVDYKLGLILTVSYILFSYLGSLINIFLKREKRQYLLKYFSAFILILSGIYFAYGAYNDTI